MIRVAKSTRGLPLHKGNISNLVRALAEKAGLQRYFTVKGGRRRGEIHTHIFRRYLKHQMRQAGISDPTLLKMLVGQKPEYQEAYDKYLDEDIREAYLKAEPYLSILPTFDERKRKIETLRTMARALNIEIEARSMASDDEAWLLEERIKERVRLVAQSFSQMRTSEQKQVFDEAIEQAKTGLSKDSNPHEFKIVKEEEELLIKYLNEGWDLVKELSNGKVVLRRNMPHWSASVERRACLHESSAKNLKIEAHFPSGF